MPVVPSGTFLSGKDGSVSVNGVLQPSIRWRIPVEVSEIDVSNQKSPANAAGEYWSEYLGGWVSGELEITCLDDPTLATPTRGATVPFVITKGAGHSITGNMILKGTEYSMEELKTKALGITYKGRVTGAPTIV